MSPRRWPHIARAECVRAGRRRYTVTKPTTTGDGVTKLSLGFVNVERIIKNKNLTTKTGLRARTLIKKCNDRGGGDDDDDYATYATRGARVYKGDGCDTG